MDLIFALLAAAVVVGAAAVVLGRHGHGSGPVGLGLLAGVAAGLAAAIVFLVPQMDLLPDQFDAGVELVVFALSGLAIAALGWRRRRAG